MSALTKFASDVDAAFTLIGGEQSKATYDWMIAAQERERIIKLLENELKRLEKWADYPATNALMNIRAALIKGEQPVGNTDKLGENK